MKGTFASSISDDAQRSIRRGVVLAIVAWLSLGAGVLVRGDDKAAAPDEGADAVMVGPADWPWWRGPTRDGVAAADPAPPMHWSATQNVLWKCDVPGRGHASPTVVGEQVFLPTADYDTDLQSVLCFDRQTGKVLWKTDVHHGGLAHGNGRASQASSTIACDGKRLFVNFLNDGAVYTTALTRDGKQLWRTKISDYVLHQGYGSSPAVYKSLVIVSADNKGGGAIAGLDRATGKVVWRVERPATPNYASPAIVRAAGREQLIFIGCNLVSSFEPMTGKTLWQIDGATTECVSTTVTDGSHIYTSGGYPRNHVSAVLADGSGKVVWENTTRVYVPSMLVYQGYLYGVTDGGVAVCWKSDTGDFTWKERLGGTFNASPVRVGKHIYATNQAGTTFIFKADPQTFAVVAQNKLGEDVFATPSICGGRIYMRVAAKDGKQRQETLYCIGMRAE